LKIKLTPGQPSTEAIKILLGNISPIAGAAFEKALAERIAAAQNPPIIP
jgi:hypothetical protein